MRKCNRRLTPLRASRIKRESYPVACDRIAVAFGMIVFNGAYILDAVLESIYPFARQIAIAEGPVGYFAGRGHKSSTDGTVELIESFPDPQGKIKLVQGQWPEKDEMCNAYMGLLTEPVSHIWHIDSDEVYKAGDIRRVMELLPNYDSVGFRSLTFFGGFDRIFGAGSFEQGAEFHRIQRYGPRWATHRPPTILAPDGRPWQEHRHLGFNELANMGVFMRHYSYVWPSQVEQKTRYYRESVAQGRCIDNFMECVYLPWVLGDDEAKARIEDEFDGCHDFLPSARGPCRTEVFAGAHPEAIEKRLPALRERLAKELEQYKKG